MRSAELRADEQRLTESIEQLTRRVASVGVDDATWEALWFGIDVSLPVGGVNEAGEFTFHAGRALLPSSMRSGLTEEQAKATAYLGDAFDELSLDQQRALVKNHVAITVRAAGRGSRPADRIEVGRL